MILSTEQIKEYTSYLCREAKSGATQEKYLRDVRAFCAYAAGAAITKATVMGWKNSFMTIMC